MKKVLIGLLLTILVFTACRRKSEGEVTLPLPDTNQNDTTLPPKPPGDSGYSTAGSNSDTTANQTVSKFTFFPQKQNLDAGNIGIEYKESNPNIFYVNIRGGYDVFGIAFDFDYDSSKLILKDVTKGDFLGSDAVLYWGNNSVVGISRPGGGGGVSGDGIVCIIKLEAKTNFDNSYIGFKNQKVSNNQDFEILPDSNWFGGVLRYE